MARGSKIVQICWFFNQSTLFLVSLLTANQTQIHARSLINKKGHWKHDILSRMQTNMRDREQYPSDSEQRRPYTSMHIKKQIKQIDEEKDPAIPKYCRWSTSEQATCWCRFIFRSLQSFPFEVQDRCPASKDGLKHEPIAFEHKLWMCISLVGATERTRPLNISERDSELHTTRNL